MKVSFPQNLMRFFEELKVYAVFVLNVSSYLGIFRVNLLFFADEVGVDEEEREEEGYGDRGGDRGDDDDEDEEEEDGTPNFVLIFPKLLRF